MGTIYVDGRYVSASRQNLINISKKNEAQDDRLDVLEELVIGGSGDIVIENPELLVANVQANTNSIKELQLQLTTIEDELVVLQGTETVIGSVDYKINEAFKWKDL